MTTLAPRLRHRIDFEMQASVRDSEGVVTLEWVPAVVDYGGELELTDIPAEVLTGPGREFQASGQVQAELAARITCRWFPGLSAAWRIRWDGQIYNVATWDTDVTGRREYRIRCTAGVNDGQ